MNIKVAAFTVSEKSSTTVEHVNMFSVLGKWHVWLFRDANRVVLSLYVLDEINKMQDIVRIFG